MGHGAGDFVFSDLAASARDSMRVFYFCPQRTKPDTQIVIAMHGFDRAASAFRDSLITVAERLRLLVMTRRSAFGR